MMKPSAMGKKNRTGKDLDDATKKEGTQEERGNDPEKRQGNPEKPDANHKAGDHQLTFQGIARLARFDWPDASR